MSMTTDAITKKYVYLFEEIDAAMARFDGDFEAVRGLLGGKGANLAEMCSLGIPVPPGFTLPTELCTKFYSDGSKLDDAVLAAIGEGVAHIEATFDGAKFGDKEKPLAISAMAVKDVAAATAAWKSRRSQWHSLQTLLAK